jgi:predicted ester cyclase
MNLILLMLIVLCMPASSVAQSGPSGERSPNQNVVLSYFHDVLDGKKLELLENLFLPDAAIHRPEGELKGIVGLRAMLQAGTWATFSTRVDDIFESGDRVVARLTHTAQGGGMYRFRIGPQDVAGKTVTWDAIVIFRMQNGRIAEEWVNRDELGMLLSAGVLKAPDSPR